MQNTIINVLEIKDYFKEYCKEENKKNTEKECQKFIECCERDFYQWLKDNLKYFETENKL